MTLNFIPDGKQKNMSVIKSVLDQKAMMSGNVTEEQKQKEQKKKDAKADEANSGEPKKLSKSELNKLKKKEAREKAKAAAKDGTYEGPADVSAIKEKSKKEKQVKVDSV